LPLSSGVAALLALMMTVQAEAAEPVQGPVDTRAMIDTARERYSPIRRCKPAEDGTIVVCGSDTADNRLSPELRAIAGVARSTRDSIPPAPEAKAMSLDKLPYNWVGTDGVLFPRAQPNALLEHVKAMEAARAAEAEAAGEVPPP
jgi:hypothetical protein